MQRRWVLPALTVFVLALLFIFRWDNQTSLKEDSVIATFTQDRWTGRVWVRAQGFSKGELISKELLSTTNTHLPWAKALTGDQTEALKYARAERTVLTITWGGAIGVCLWWFYRSFRKPPSQS